jgi:hypothetical protein
MHPEYILLTAAQRSHDLHDQARRERRARALRRARPAPARRGHPPPVAAALRALGHGLTAAGMRLVEAAEPVRRR